MADRIKLSPQEMYAAAKTMRDKRDVITEEMRVLKINVDETMEHWEGKAKAAYLPLFNETYDNVLNALTESINGLADGLDGAAKAFEDTDDGIAGAYGEG